MFEIGAVLDGKYEILKRIGKGATALVYLAMNPKLNQQLVIKEIDGNLVSRDRERALAEARMMIKFDHPAIPRIVDILEERYIIMDYIPGQNLHEILRDEGPQPQEVVVEWGKQLCNVLGYLHSLNPPIIYHDLKPGNIVLKVPERTLKLLDFGEARPCINGNAPGAGKTKEYAAPEQQKETRGNTDQRTDIYCLGTTLYRLLTGKFAPMPPETVGSIRDRFPELNISKGMDNIIRKCTQHDPKKRFQSTEEVFQALENIQLWDEDYLKKLKRRIHSVYGVLGATVVMVGLGFGFRGAANYVNAQDYENLVATATSVEHSVKTQNYEEAIKINGTNPEAYIKLLEAYEDNNLFGNQEGQQFSTLYNANKSKFDVSSEEVWEMHFLTGRLYFNMYSGENDSFRSRILKAKSYFEFVREHADTSYSNYSIASSYYTLCDFFEKYVLSDNSIQEPTKEDYYNMMAALNTCLEDMQKYSEGDAAYTRLNLYGYILDMVNVNIRGFALNDITQEEVKNILTSIREAANNESITQEASIQKRESLLMKIDNILDNLQREYKSLERGQ